MESKSGFGKIFAVIVAIVIAGAIILAILGYTIDFVASPEKGITAKTAKADTNSLIAAPTLQVTPTGCHPPSVVPPFLENKVPGVDRIFDDSSSRLIPLEDIKFLIYWCGSMATTVLQHEINYIYADAGYHFQVGEHAEFFASQGYIDRGLSMEEARSRFSDIQEHNAEALKTELDKLT